jgi:hypothetical protein
MGRSVAVKLFPRGKEFDRLMAPVFGRPDCKLLAFSNPSAVQHVGTEIAKV